MDTHTDTCTATDIHVGAATSCAATDSCVATDSCARTDSCVGADACTCTATSCTATDTCVATDSCMHTATSCMATDTHAATDSHTCTATESESESASCPTTSKKKHSSPIDDDIKLSTQNTKCIKKVSSFDLHKFMVEEREKWEEFQGKMLSEMEKGNALFVKSLESTQAFQNNFLDILHGAFANGSCD